VEHYGGFTDAARMLDERAPRLDGKPHTRQQVWVWYSRRKNNGFPERYEITIEGEKRYLFALRDIYTWYLHYRPSQGGRPVGKGKGT